MTKNEDMSASNLDLPFPTERLPEPQFRSVHLFQTKARGLPFPVASLTDGYITCNSSYENQANLWHICFTAFPYSWRQRCLFLLQPRMT